MKISRMLRGITEFICRTKRLQDRSPGIGRTIQKLANASDGIKPRVERSGTRGRVSKKTKLANASDGRWNLDPSLAFASSNPKSETKSRGKSFDSPRLFHLPRFVLSLVLLSIDSVVTLRFRIQLIGV